MLLTGVVWGQQQGGSPEDRAAALVAKMTLAEKVAQMGNTAPAIPRLNIPAYDWWNEALHGVARAGLATVFPQAIGLAATWDTDLEFRVADAISTEARGKYNEAIRRNEHGRYQGLTFWSPNINILCDPRWGRGQETYGEDPYLTSRMAMQFIRGMQGSDPHYFKTIATSKHFAVHSGPETGRHEFNAQVSEQDLQDTYFSAFQATTKPGGAYSVMCAYNRLDGAPACASEDLLKTRLREQWHFPGYVVSDCGAVADIFEGHHYAASMSEAAAKAVRAGTDLSCGSEYKTLPDAVAKGFITEAEIDRSVTRLLVARIRLGMFDPPERVPFSKIGMDQVATAEHRQLALEAAEKSMVLLKNENELLPLRKPPRKIAVVGPAADDPDVLLGNYYGAPRRLVTPLVGIQDRFSKNSAVTFALGSVYAESSTALIPAKNLGSDLQAEYFNGLAFKGAPVLSRKEPRAYFAWAMADPAIQKALPEPTFSARWTGKLQADQAGEYQLGFARGECDSCKGSIATRLYVDGKLLVEQSRRAAGGAEAKTASIHLQAGQSHDLRLEYTQQAAGFGVELVWTPPAADLMTQAMATARESDLVIAVLGLNSRLEGEESKVKIAGFAGGDRTDLDLPANQEKLLRAVLGTGKPVIVVLVNGSALSVNTAAEQARAVLEAWYPGQEGGTAIARTLAGENNPAGRLPVTFYRSVKQLPAFDDYSMQGRTYRYFKGTPLFAFGSGLSYSKFEYSKVSKTDRGVSSSVRNVSATDGDEVVQLYLQKPDGLAELKGFQRIHLNAGQSLAVRFPIDSELSAGSRWYVGGSQPVSHSESLQR